MEAGEARERVKILSLAEGDGALRWEETRMTWAKVEETGARNLFSSVGLAAGTVMLTIRRQALGLDQMLEWKGQRLFITAITPRSRDSGWLEVTTGKVRVLDCVTKRRGPVKAPLPSLCFPGVLTEKYQGYDPGKAQAEVTSTYVLVTPKTVELAVGDVYAAAGMEGAYNVTACHILDQYKNEYEATWRRDA